MSLGPIDPSLILARLKQAPALGFRKFGGAADLRAAQDAKPITPALYVLAARERANGNPIANAVRQRVSCTLALVYAVSNVADPTGKAAADALQPLRLATLTRLIGWPPSVDNSPILMLSGNLVGFVDQVLWWQDEISTDYLLTGPNP